MAWYKTGKVAVTNGSATVTGTGTDFVSNARVGDAFIGPNGALHEVTNVASATVLSISPVYGGATASNASFGIVPVQGYVKQLVDQAGLIITQWGATLAGLGPVASQSVVPLTMGGTGGTTAADARNGLGLKRAAVADIAGTVSQAAGVPTGAIFEQGSNASGHYIKFASGAMICWGTATYSGGVTSAAGGHFISPGGHVLTWPAQFAGTAPVELSGGVTEGAYRVICVPYRSNVTSGTMTFQLYVSSAADVVFSWKAIGRWF